jgi:hypothetical protein
METGGSPRDSCCLYVGDMIPLPFAHSASASAEPSAQETNNRSDDRGMRKSQSAGEGKCRGRRTKSWFRFASRHGAKKGRKGSANRGRRAGKSKGPGRGGNAVSIANRTRCRRAGGWIHGRNGMAKTDGRRGAGRGCVRASAAGPLAVAGASAAVSAWHGIQRVPRGDEASWRRRRNRTYAHPEPCNGTACSRPQRDKRNDRSWGKAGRCGTGKHARRGARCPPGCSVAQLTALACLCTFPFDSYHQNVHPAQLAGTAA